jgi:carboxymethylenebutenolidase
MVTLGLVGSRVSESRIEIETPDGAMETFVACPGGDGLHPLAIMVQHIGGLSPTMEIMARRMAAEGLRCAVPALYHRLGRIVVDPLATDERVAAIRAIASASLTAPQVMSDIAAVLLHFATRSGARPGPAGIIGYGGGAGLALLAATWMPEAIRATACVLGVGFVKDTTDSPHLALGKLRGPVYCAFAEDDHIIPAADVERLRTFFREHEVASEIVVHPRARHGYCFPNRDVYDRQAAERDWAAIGAMFRRVLSADQQG